MGMTPERVDVTTVLIVGGGIGGLAAALALSTAGASVTLVEHAPEFGEVGAGLQLGPNATRILAEWGLLDEVIELGVLPGNLILRDAVSADELTRQPLGREFVERYGAPYVVVHRSDLHGILLRAAERAGIQLVTNQHIERVETRGAEAVATTSTGDEYLVDVVIGADGLKSTLRSQVSQDEPIASGYVAYRGTFPIDVAQREQDSGDVVAWLGNSCHLVQYPLRQGSMLNQVAVFRSPAFFRGEAEWGGPDELEAAYADCAPAVRSALTHIWKDRNWPMFDREPIQNWVDGRLLMIGDGAHPMLQYLAQGACQALEDADTLGDLAARHVFGTDGGDRAGWDVAAAEFNRLRAPRTARVQRTARLWGESWHVSGIGRVLRNELFRRRDTTDYRYTDWLYGQELLPD